MQDQVSGKRRFKAVVIDLDGTLCNVVHRLKHLDPTHPEYDYEAWNDALVNDEPNDWCLFLLRMLFKKGFAVILLTGRPERVRQITKDWLIRHSIQYDKLLMKPDEYDHMPSEDFKDIAYEKFIKPNYDVLFCLDDTAKVSQMWRSKGLVALQCADDDA